MTYCLREVSSNFEGVRCAYPSEDPETDLEGMRFIQIWVEGDDFALMDSYYRDGVRW